MQFFYIPMLGNLILVKAVDQMCYFLLYLKPSRKLIYVLELH